MEWGIYCGFGGTTVNKNPHNADIDQCIKTAFNRFLADREEEVALIDNTSEEEDKLRKDYNAAKKYPITSIFRDNLFAIAEVFREWAPKNTVVQRNIYGRFTANMFEDYEGKDLVGV